MTSKSSKRTTADVHSVTFSPYTMRRHREELGAWLKEIGIDPNTVSADHPVRVAGGRVTYSALLLDTDAETLSQAAAGCAPVVERSCACSVAPPALHRDAMSDIETD